MEKKFPEYFKNFDMPIGAREESILVYRACKTGKADKESFIPTFEENGMIVPDGFDISNPSVYSLSVYSKPRDIKRFVALSSDYKGYKIAQGYTNPKHGLVQPTKEREHKKSSHIDWWLYENATPYEEFCIIDDFNSFLNGQNTIKYYKLERRII